MIRTIHFPRTVTSKSGGDESADTRTVAKASTGVATRRRPSVHNRGAAVFVAALILTTFGVTTTSETASAASGVSACFRTRTGLVIARTNVFLELYVFGQWYPAAMKNTNQSGCAAFALSGDSQKYPARIRMQAKTNGDSVGGTTYYYGPAGSGSYNLGTVNPWCIGMCYGY